MVYVLSVIWQCDSGDIGSELFAFNSFDLAQQEMLKQMELARKDFNHLDTEESEYVDGDMEWGIWEKEEYAYNHIDIAITALPIRTK